MRLFSALALLFAAGVKNRIRRQLQRMRQPRFLIATAAGLFYFWQVLFRRWWAFTRPVQDSPLREIAVGDLRPLVEAFLILLVLVQVMGSWVFGDERAQLAFTEPEVQFMFPAPVSRLSLVNYKLVRAMLWLVLGALVTAALIGRVVSHHPWFFVGGAWIALTTTSLHRTAASFTRQRMAERGLWGRVLVWTLVGAAVAAIAWAHWRVLGRVQLDPDAQTPRELAGWAAQIATQLFESRPAAWVLWPARALVRPMLAQDTASFVRALPVAVGLLLLQYVWAVVSVAPFEEASAEAAELRGRMLESRRNRTGLKGLKARRHPWSLAGEGRPEVALTWKNAIAVVRQFQPRAVIVLVGLTALMLVVVGRAPEASILRLIMLASFVGMTVLFGPVRMNLDLRHDVSRIDMLRALPLRGRQIVLAELVAPAVMLTVLEWALLAAALIPGGADAPLGPEARAGIAAAAVVLAPALTVMGLVIQNAAAMLFPEWMSVFRERRRGFDAMGQRLLTMAGSALVIGLGAAPAAGIGGLVLFLLWSFTPLYWSAAPIAAAVACVALLVEIGLGVAAVGRLFETHDVSQA